MKKILLFAFALITLSLSAQSIQYKNTEIKIVATGMSNITNQIRYEIQAPLSIENSDTLGVLFPNKQFISINGKLVSADMVNVPNMDNIFDIYQIEQNDVGNKVKYSVNKWSCNLIYLFDLLPISQTDWRVIN